MGAVRGPLGGEHRVDLEVQERVVQDLRVALGALVREPEALRDGAAARVIRRRADHHAVQLEVGDEERRQRAGGMRDQATALERLGDPVADLR